MDSQFFGKNGQVGWELQRSLSPLGEVVALDRHSGAYPTAARRPLNSRLDTTRLAQTFGLTLPPWQHGVARMLAETL